VLALIHSTMLPLAKNYSENEVRALHSIFQYYSKSDGDGGISHAHQHQAQISSAALYRIIEELSQDDTDASRMKSAMEENHLHQKQELGNDVVTLLGTLSFQSFLAVVDNGRTLQDSSQHINFLRVLHEYQRRCFSEGNYLKAQGFMRHVQCLRKAEGVRHLQLVKTRQTEHRRKLDEAHKIQFDEFTQSWNTFMNDFESMSQGYIEELNETHQSQLSSLQKDLTDELNSKSKRFSKDLVDWRKREVIMADQQFYQEAQRIKQVSDALEAKEKSNMNSRFENSLRMKEANVKRQQSAEMDALVKRIDTKRREYEKQREVNTERLSQRNKNILSVMDTKHVS
jgi:hypothetical protein